MWLLIWTYSTEKRDVCKDCPRRRVYNFQSGTQLNMQIYKKEGMTPQ